VGADVRFVGGCVRDAVLGRAVNDIDVGTPEPPPAVVERLDAAGIKVVPTGIDHGTVTVISGHIAYEVTTFRRDVETFGRHATVAFSDDVAEDAARRDFTMNALYATPEGEIVDPLGGLPDLLARQLRFVGAPKARIEEDYLRILRFFRFHAWYADDANGFDAEGLAACAALSPGIETLSRERIGAEMRKLLSAADPAPLGPLVHLEAGRPPHWLRRLALLAGPEIAGTLRLSRAEAKGLAVLHEGIGSARGAAELGYRHGADRATDILLCRAALAGQPLAARWQEAVAQGAAAEFPLKAADLMPGLSGPALGRRLAELEARWIASGFRLGRDDLLG
jgi:poly(A) polymerase